MKPGDFAKYAALGPVGTAISAIPMALGGWTATKRTGRGLLRGLEALDLGNATPEALARGLRQTAESQAPDWVAKSGKVWADMSEKEQASAIAQAMEHTKNLMNKNRKLRANIGGQGASALAVDELRGAQRSLGAGAIGSTALYGIGELANRIMRRGAETAAESAVPAVSKQVKRVPGLMDNPNMQMAAGAGLLGTGAYLAGD
jgi:hypothetical protein